MSAQRQKPVAFAAEGLHLAFLSIATAESGIIEHGTCRFSYAIHLLKLRGRSNVKIFVGKIASGDWLSPSRLLIFRRRAGRHARPFLLLIAVSSEAPALSVARLHGNCSGSTTSPGRLSSRKPRK